MKAKTKEERMEIKRNDEVNCLAKLATGLPLPDYEPTHLGNIDAKGGPTPSMAKKWVIERRHHDVVFRDTLAIMAPPQKNAMNDLGKMAVG